MALIKCSECGKEISDKAASCPHCGNPLQPTVVKSIEKPIVTEKTGKEWKLMILVSSIGLAVGIIMMFDRNIRNIGSFVAGWSLILLIAGKIGAWWNHA